MMIALRRALVGSVLFLLAVTVAGCGPDMKAENDALKKQVADLQAKLKPPAKPAAKPAAKPPAPKK